MSEVISEVLRWLSLISIYIIFVGMLFTALRWLMYRFGSSKILTYNLWLIFPFGVIIIAGLQFIQPEILATSKLAIIKPLMVIFAEPVGSSYISWQPVVFSLWLFGACVLLTHLLIKYLILKNTLQNSCMKPGEIICVTNRVTAPLAFGLFFPKVYIPQNFFEIFNQIQQDLILEHEQQHCARYDPLVRLIYKIFTCLFWFHPIIYLISNLMKKDQEISCDQFVLERFDLRQEYSKLLLKLNQNAQFSGGGLNDKPIFSELYCSSTSMLKERIMLINKSKVGKSTGQYRFVGPVGLSIAIIGLLLATVSLAFDEKPKDSTMSISTVESDFKLKPIVEIKPRYPTYAAKEGISGYVTMEFDLNVDASVSNIQVVDSEPEDLFDNAAVTAMKKYKFVPISEVVRVQHTIEFTIDR